MFTPETTPGSTVATTDALTLTDHAIGPDGMLMTEGDLPPPNTKRWVARRKAQVVAGVRAGLLTLDEACKRYTLTAEEFLSWAKAIDRHGVRGLRVTRLQDYR